MDDLSAHYDMKYIAHLSKRQDELNSQIAAQQQRKLQVEKNREWIKNCASSYPAWSKPRIVDAPHDPEQHIEQTARRRGLMNWMWCCLVVYAWILFALYMRYAR